MLVLSIPPLPETLQKELNKSSVPIVKIKVTD